MMLSLSRRAIPRVCISLKKATTSNARVVIQANQTRNISEYVKHCFPKGDPMLTVGNYPRTQEERERAAKKYNLIPEDYEPYDEDEGWGDYPKLKAIGGFNRDRYDDFDDILDDRFYGEPFHKDADLYYYERIDPLEPEKRRLSYWISFPVFVGLAFFVPVVYWLLQHFKININRTVKQRPQQLRSDYEIYKCYEFPPSPNDKVHH